MTQQMLRNQNEAENSKWAKKLKISTLTRYNGQKTCNGNQSFKHHFFLEMCSVFEQLALLYLIYIFCHDCSRWHDLWCVENCGKPNGVAQKECKDFGKTLARLDFSYLKDLKFDDIESVTQMWKTFNTEG